MSCQDDFRNIRGLPDVIGQSLRNLAVSYGSSVEDPNLRWIWPRLDSDRTNRVFDVFKVFELRNLGNGVVLATIAQAGFDQLPRFAFGRLMVRQCDGPLGLLCFFPMRDCPRILLGIEVILLVPPWHCRAVDMQMAACPVRAASLFLVAGGRCFVRQRQRLPNKTLGCRKRQVKRFVLWPEEFLLVKSS
jgi:hypothetical protein